MSWVAGMTEGERKLKKERKKMLSVIKALGVQFKTFEIGERCPDEL